MFQKVLALIYRVLVSICLRLTILLALYAYARPNLQAAQDAIEKSAAALRRL